MSRLLNNWKLKLTSLVIAIALWGHVRNEVNPPEDATFRVRLEAPPPPPNLMLLNARDIPKIVKVNVMALHLTLRELKGVPLPNPLAPAEEAPLLPAAQMYATLDFSLARPGRQTVPVKIVTSLENLSEVTPKISDIILEFAPAASAEMQIEPQFAGNALQNYFIEEVTMVPRLARVFGPAPVIARVAKLRARIAAPNELAGELSVKAAPLEAVDKAGRVLSEVRVEPETVAVSAMLREKSAHRTVPLTLKLDDEPASGFAVEKSEISPARVRLQGPRAALEALTEIPAHLSVAGEKAPLRRHVKIELPPGVTLATPGEIWATVQIVPAETVAPTTTPPASPASPTPSLPPPATPGQ